jgi:hypothetical protein
VLGDELFATVFATVVLSGIAFFSFFVMRVVWQCGQLMVMVICIFPFYHLLATLPSLSYFLHHHPDFF